MSLSPRAAEAADKLSRLRALMTERGATAVVLTRIANFAWLTGGGRSFINIAAEGGAAWIAVTPARVAVVTSNIEAERLREEELAGLDWEVLAADWWDDGGMQRRLAEVVGGSGPVLADGGVPGAVDGAAAVTALRTRLSEPEQVRAAELGRETATALEDCCRTIRSGDTEFAIAGRLAAECLTRGIVPIVHLVASDKRVYTRRHPLPTRAAVDKYAMVVVCGLRGGLVVSCTRLVHLGTVEEDLRRRVLAAATVDAEMIAATRPGTTSGGVFAAARAAYARTGFADEWQRHHQGGLAGYASREWRAVPDGAQTIAEGQIFAWNPSVAGAKSEDTVLSTGEPAGPRVLTETGRWPLLEIRTSGGALVRRPDILEV